MGAEFNFAELKAKDDKAALAEAREVIERAGRKYGHGGYSGSFAECPSATVAEAEPFDSPDAAEEWLEEHAEKWRDALIVKTKDGSYYMGAWCSS